jgi:hypothetical protein
MVTEEELAFLKVQLAELSPTVVKQLKRDIVSEKRREAAEPAKTERSGGRPIGQPNGRKPTSAGEAGNCNRNSSSMNTALIFATSTRPTSSRDGP